MLDLVGFRWALVDMVKIIFWFWKGTQFVEQLSNSEYIRESEPL
jgi:hypothetical protein